MNPEGCGTSTGATIKFKSVYFTLSTNHTKICLNFRAEGL
jgi:hypothetical protein